MNKQTNRQLGDPSTSLLLTSEKVVFCNIRISYLKELEERAYWYSVVSQSERQSQLSLLTRAMMLMKLAVLEELATKILKVEFRGHLHLHGGTAATWGRYHGTQLSSSIAFFKVHSKMQLVRE